MECKLEVTAGYKSGRSYIKDLYVGKPFRLVSVGQRKKDNKLYQMLMTSSPGILDGDHYVIDINLEEYAELQLQVQSYQRLFTNDEGSSQHLTVNMQDHTSFAYVPHPTAPFKDSTYKGQVTFDIADDCQVIVGDIVTCGRKHHGEMFKMEHYQNITQFFHNNQLIVKDNIIIKPDIIPVNTIGILEDYTHQGSLLFYSTKTGVDKDKLVRALLEKAKTHETVEVGISSLDEAGFVVRALGHGGEAIHSFFLQIQDFLWDLKYEPTTIFKNAEQILN